MLKETKKKIEGDWHALSYSYDIDAISQRINFTIVADHIKLLKDKDGYFTHVEITGGFELDFDEAPMRALIILEYPVSTVQEALNPQRWEKIKIVRRGDWRHCKLF